MQLGSVGGSSRTRPWNGKHGFHVNYFWTPWEEMEKTGEVELVLSNAS